MKVTVTHNAANVGLVVQHVFSDQLPWVTMNAINDSAKMAQKAQRAHQRKAFTVRRKGWVDRAVKIKPFATKQLAEAKISIDPPGGQARADILTQHEADDRKRAFDGGFVAVPTEHVQRTAAGVIRARERPKALQLREESGKRQTRGQRRGTFRRKGGNTIFERTPDGGIRALYQLVRSVDLDQRLEFVDTVVESVQATYATNFETRFDQAIGIRGRR